MFELSNDVRVDIKNSSVCKIANFSVYVLPVTVLHVRRLVEQRETHVPQFLQPAHYKNCIAPNGINESLKVYMESVPPRTPSTVLSTDVRLRVAMATSFAQVQVQSGTKSDVGGGGGGGVGR